MRTEVEAVGKVLKELAQLGKVGGEGTLVGADVVAAAWEQAHSVLLEEAEEIEHMAGMVAHIAEA